MAYLTQVRLRNFTVFEGELSLEFKKTPGLHVFTGPNATGKTHMLQVLYAAVSLARARDKDATPLSPYAFAEKLIDVFRPAPPHLGRLASRKKGSVQTTIEVARGPGRLYLSFTNHTRGYTAPVKERKRGTLETKGLSQWIQFPVYTVFIPAQDVMVYAHGGVYFAYRRGDVVIPGHHADLMETAFYRGIARGATPREMQPLIEELEHHFGRRVEIDITRLRMYIVERSRRKIEVPLVAEGVRKLALLWLLVKNRDLRETMVLFWDEPEAHLHPAWIRVIGRMLTQLALSTQIFIATHSHVLLEEIEMSRKSLDPSPYVRFYVFTRYQDEEGIRVHASETLETLEPDPLYAALWSQYLDSIEET